MCDQDKRDAGRLFDAFNDIQPRAGTASRAIERTRQALLQRSLEPDAAVGSWWNIRANRRVFAAAAALVIIVASFVLPTLFAPSVAAAFAQVREQLGRVRTIAFDVSVEIPGAPTETLHQMIRNDGKSREQYPDGRYVVSERTEHAWTRLEVNPIENTAHVTYGYPQALPFDLLGSIHDLPGSEAASPIGPRTINGRSCPGFLITLEANGTSRQMRFWIDPESHLPVHGVVTAAVQQKRSDGAAGNEPGDTNLAVATMSNFKYNIELDASRFALTPSEGYAVTTHGSPPERRSDRWPAEKLLVTVGQGIGPVKFGMSKEQVAEVFGEPEERMTGPERWFYNSQGFEISFAGTASAVDRIVCQPESPRRRAFQGRTIEGVGLGSSPEDVLRAYPDLLKEQSINKDGFGLYRYPDMRLVVSFVDGVVYRLRISSIPNRKSRGE